MSGFWLKWEKGLTRKPEVLQIAARLMMSPAEAAGRLMLVMEWLDDTVTELSQDGDAEVELGALAPNFIDTIAGTQGFSEALAEVKWLRIKQGSLVFVNFGKHNGITAKKRADASARQRKSRNTGSDRRGTNQSGRTIPRPLRRFVLERDRYQCVFCGIKSSSERESSEGKRTAILSVDHLLPHSKGGVTEERNLVCSCRKCNMEKSGRTLEEWGVLPTHLQQEVQFKDGCVTITSQHRVTELSRLCSVSVSALPVSGGGSGGGEKRARNEVLDALAVVGGGKPEEVPPSAWSGVAKSLADIRAVCPDVTADEIRRRAANYRTHFRDAVISPQALAKHWARCSEPSKQTHFLTDEDAAASKLPNEFKKF